MLKNNIKYVVGMLLATVFLSACGSSENAAVSSSGTTVSGAIDTSVSDAYASETTEESQEIVSDLDAEDSVSEDADKDSNDTLVIYFSANNLNDVDAVSSATPMVGEESAVEWMANIIHDEVGGNLVQIVPSEDYPLEYDATADLAKTEADSDARPTFNNLDIDPTSYSRVFIGYPIWWYRMPMIMETFFDTYDFDGVTIIPFNTHLGSRNGGTYDMIRDREPGATVLEGIPVSGSDVGKDSSKEDILKWLNGLDLD
ncbi:flavodoxin [Butyrivibrio sp.]|uniref:flavodoxin n=1 Tax=Butyrivibrio sp. TaxID=28121 RepID=UPI0025C05A2E|nr:flavodoxin [Butyrivibrio sp.]MBQ9303000.1 hypothetical protein [Butyrivibrio sp.]